MIDLRDLQGFEGVARQGRVLSVRGVLLRATLPEVRLGELVRIRPPRGPETEAEVIGFDPEGVTLMPLGELSGVAIGSEVLPARRLPSVPCGACVEGRVLDALGRPIDDHGPLVDPTYAPLHNAPPRPTQRLPIDEVVDTGVRAIDALLTLGRGQRIGLFAAAGVGKTTLLGSLARNVRADRVVVALIGERGREVPEFLSNHLPLDGPRKTTVVVSTSDQPALLRLRAAYVATAIAEEARARGEHVVLMMDSVTRFARALREVGLAASEPPGRQGYPPSVFASLPKLFERAGNDANGHMTAIYTVLVTGDDLEEPIADEAISLLDGHVILSRKIAERERRPAIDVLKSVSRSMNDLIDEDHAACATLARKILENHDRNETKIDMGLYDPEDEEKRRFLELHAPLVAFLHQSPREAVTSSKATVERLRRLLLRTPS